MRTWLLLILFALLVAGCAQRTVSGSHTASTSKRFDGTLRVLTYNIHHANPPGKEGVIDLAAIARVITAQAPDLVALQEVDVYTSRSGKTLHQAEELGRLTGMRAYFAKAIDYAGGEYGVAMLSKYPVEEINRVALPTLEGTGGEPRVLLTGAVSLPGGAKIRFASTHLDAQQGDTNRVAQMIRIIDVLEGDPLPVVLAGDFNDTPSSRTIALLDRQLTRTCAPACPPTFPVLRPAQTIDFIAFRPAGAFRVERHAVVEEHEASDHLPVSAVLKLKKR